MNKTDMITAVSVPLRGLWFLSFDVRHGRGR